MDEPRSSSQPAATIRSRVSSARCWRSGLSYRRDARAGSRSRDEDRQRLPTPDGGGGRQLGPVPVDVPLREAPEQLVERHPALEAGQRGAEAEVRAVAERDVGADLAVDVELVARSASGGRRGWRSRGGGAWRCPAAPSGRGAPRPWRRSARRTAPAARSAAAPRWRSG